MNHCYPIIPEFRPLTAEPYCANVVQHWGFFSRAEIEQNAGKLMMLDVDFGRACSLRCPTCFRRRNAVDDDDRHDLDYEQLMKVVEEAVDLGLKTVKICGAGEPLENPQLLRFARDLTARGVGLAIFTKGHILGDDALVARVYGKEGISDARSLCAELFKLKTSFLVGFQSADCKTQDILVGGVNGHALRRNRALELLAEAGFNKTSPSRLAMCTNPLTKDNYDGVYDIYAFARKRNILPVVAVLMVSGRQIDDDFLAQYDVSNREKEELFAGIYEYNLVHGYHTEKMLSEEGISCMPGIHPCNQIAAGLYMTCNGNVIRCPGDSGTTPLGNVREEGIAEIWARSKDWSFAGTFNCRCPYKDGITLPTGLYEKTLTKVLGKAQPTMA